MGQEDRSGKKNNADQGALERHTEKWARDDHIGTTKKADVVVMRDIEKWARDDHIGTTRKADMVVMRDIENWGGKIAQGEQESWHGRHEIGRRDDRVGTLKRERERVLLR